MKLRVMGVADYERIVGHRIPRPEDLPPLDPRSSPILAMLPTVPSFKASLLEAATRRRCRRDA